MKIIISFDTYQELKYLAATGFCFYKIIISAGMEVSINTSLWHNHMK